MIKCKMTVEFKVLVRVEGFGEHNDDAGSNAIDKAREVVKGLCAELVNIPAQQYSEVKADV